MTKTLNSKIVRAMIVLTLFALALVYIGMMTYFFIIYEWIYPNVTTDEYIRTGDIVTLGILLAIGILSASIFGAIFARRIVEPLNSVSIAARKIAKGDFSARASLRHKNFGEARDLVNDFNHMAERLQRAETELQYSNSAIAHELRTPLTVLRGRLQGLLDGAFIPSPELYSRLIEHVDNLSAIVEELRTLALSNAGQLELHVEKLDLSIEAESALISYEDQLNQAGIKVTKTFHSAQTQADRSRIRQAMIALLENCCRYAPQSTLHVETGYEENNKFEKYVFFRCSDTGPGLSADNKQRAFERFWRADESRGRSRGGSGLGLSIIKAIAKAHKGDAFIISSYNKGLAIQIQLPY